MQILNINLDTEKEIADLVSDAAVGDTLILRTTIKSQDDHNLGVRVGTAEVKPRKETVDGEKEKADEDDDDMMDDEEMDGDDSE